jgi:hypothetical protein
MRAEWVGQNLDAEGDWAFHPPDAGHPHWQVDIAEVQFDEEWAAAQELLRETAPREFDGALSHRGGRRPYQNFGRVHLAAAMRPWSDSNIAHGPSCLADVRKWVQHTARVLNVELARVL